MRDLRIQTNVDFPPVHELGKLILSFDNDAVMHHAFTDAAADLDRVLAIAAYYVRIHMRRECIEMIVRVVHDLTPFAST